MSKELQAWRVSEIVETLREVQDPNEDISPTLARKWLVRDVTDLLAERDATRARLAQLEAVAEAAERVAAWAPPGMLSQWCADVAWLRDVLAELKNGGE